MTDTELREALELAALACGYSVTGWDEFCGELLGVECSSDGREFICSPHLDDGDSRRLQVELGIDLIYGNFPSNEWTATKRSNDGKIRISFVSGDPKVAVLNVVAETGRLIKAGLERAK